MRLGRICFVFGYFCLSERTFLRVMPPEICCIGHLTKDQIRTPMETRFMPGGTSFYFAYALCNLPHEIDFELITKLGRDDMQIVRDMERDGIRVRALESPDTLYFVNIYGENQNNRKQLVLAHSEPFTWDEISDAHGGYLHLGTLMSDDFSPETIERLAANGRLSIDVQGFLRRLNGKQVEPCEWKEMDRVLPQTEILKLNEYEMKTITGSDNLKEVARTLTAKGVKEVVITLGDYGSVIFAEERFYNIPAYSPLHIVDATGCGDTYAAGYLYCRSKGMDYGESGRFAAAMCTLKLEHAGPFAANPEEIKKKMERIMSLPDL